MRKTRTAALTAAAVAALGTATLVGLGPASAAPAADTKATAGAVARPCGVNDVSFYFGGLSAGLGQRSFQITLLAHDGVTCALTDTPLVSVSGPPDQKKPIPVTVNGRGGTLVLRTNSPLHTTVFYSAPDTTEHTLKVTTLTLAMPDGTSRSVNFLFPGETDIYSGGVSLTSWTTGIGLGEGEEAF
ncbi:hypothetical protein ACFO3J_17545 [Streptomyces polygonati]|uniref:DUF4232 domain-containing protein n=1 Tax=Streptomyces polygonati TaxID=1617087 RepID=A0ABV8HR74_9ACTN